MLVFALHSAAAAAISFQIIQHDPAQDEIRSSSYVIEGVFFDYFFDKGFIVTNSPTAVSSSTAEDKVVYYGALEDARNGGCDYFVALVTEYDAKLSKNPQAVLLSNISDFSWEIFDVHSGNKIASGSKSPGSVDTRKDNSDGVSNFARLIARLIEQSLSGR
ncbi:MAG: hypothetical protein II187_08405 [Treponema sp.]|jgi:hypothetical protein|nr:hypothetical protein [Treponema sp.]